MYSHTSRRDRQEKKTCGGLKTVCLSLGGLSDVSHFWLLSRPNPPSWTVNDPSNICLFLHRQPNRLNRTWCCRLRRHDTLPHNPRVVCPRRLLDHLQDKVMALRRSPILRCNIKTIYNGRLTGQRGRHSPRGSFLPLPLPLLWRRQTSSPTADRLCLLGVKVGLLQRTSRREGRLARESEYLHSTCIPFLHMRIKGP